MLPYKGWYHGAPPQRVVPWCSLQRVVPWCPLQSVVLMVLPTKCGTMMLPHKGWYHGAPPQRVVPWCSPTKGGTIVHPHSWCWKILLNEHFWLCKYHVPLIFHSMTKCMLCNVYLFQLVKMLWRDYRRHLIDMLLTLVFFLVLHSSEIYLVMECLLN